jgi:plastocyanin
MLRRRLAVLVVTLAGLALGASGCTLPTTDDGGGYGPSGQSGKGNQQVLVTPQVTPVVLKSGVTTVLKASNSTWAPANYVAKEGSTVAFKVVNGDGIQHNFTFEGETLSKNLPTGSQVLVRFAAPGPGKHRFYCKYQRQEMQGWITVQ